MGKRKLRDIYKIQILSVKRQNKKNKQLQQIPTFKNLEIDYNRINDNNIAIAIKNILGEEKTYLSHILSIKKYGSDYKISSIKCPICNATLEINKNWFCFICQKCDKHEKQIFEVVRVIN